MEYAEFITHVQSLAQSESREEVERAVFATLETINECIPAEEAQNLAIQLPQELGDYLQGQEGEVSQNFHLEEFISRTSQRENLAPTTAAMHVRAVFAVLQNAIPPDKFAKFHAILSHDYQQLFTI